jgi:hypothetical protein
MDHSPHNPPRVRQWRVTMAKSKLDYVHEFQKWNGASDTRKIQIALDQACLISDGLLDRGPAYDDSMTLDTITPCGKRLGDCYKADLDAMAAWHRALAAAAGTLAKALKRALAKREGTAHGPA